MIDLEEIISEWQNEKTEYESLGKFMQTFLSDRIFESGLKCEVSFRTKDLVSIIKKIKKKRKEREYNLDSLSDKLGLRIICNYNSDLDVIDKLIDRYLDVEKTEYKKEELDFDKLGYTSNHYDVKLGEKEYYNGLEDLSGLIFELQVRTLNQHAWSNIVHELSYKQEGALNDSVKRKIYRLSSLYEIADDEFAAVNKSISESAETESISMLKALEPFLYKYAKVDYDRETSMSTIKGIIEHFSIEQINLFKAKIPEFINKNNTKITTVFDENKENFYRLSLLTQPEVFLVWYCLEDAEYVLRDNWSNHSDDSELETISNLWGIIIE